MQEYLFIYFSMAGHGGFLNDVSITSIDKTDLSDLFRRKYYWRQTLKTMALYGLNIEDSIRCLSLFSLFYTVMPVCFKDYDFRRTESSLLVNIINSFIVCLLLLLLLLFLWSLWSLFLLALLLSLSPLHYLFVLP